MRAEFDYTVTLFSVGVDVMTMCSRFRNLILVATLVVLSESAAMSADQQKQVSEDLQIRLRFLNADHAYEAVQSYKRLFLTGKQEDLLTLSQDSEITIALQAYWELRDRDANELHERADVEHRLTRLSAARFIGFLEGRAGVTVPAWWRRQIRYINSDMGLVTDLREINYERLLKESSEDFPTSGLVEHNISMSRQGDEVVVTKERETVSIPISIVRKYINERFTVSITEYEVYFAFYEYPGVEFPLVCCDRRTKKVVWETTVWSGSGAKNGSVPPLDHFIGLVIEKNQIAVFGTGELGGAFVEGFRRDTGKVTFRFFNSYDKGGPALGGRASKGVGGSLKPEK